MAKDFRYILDGHEVEAFQMTKSTRYQEKEWPSWMNSRYLVTYDNGEQRLNINNEEQVIPSLGWVVKYPDGIKAVDCTVMEAAVKVVQDEVVVHPEAKVDEEALLELAAKMTGKSVEELRAEEEARKADSKPALTVVPTPQVTNTVESDRGLLFEVRATYELLLNERWGEATIKLGEALLDRCNWCDCPPGRCNGAADIWDCRRNSPLAKEIK